MIRKNVALWSRRTRHFTAVALSLALTAGIAGTAFAGGADKYTQYVADYTGKNLASFGYFSLGGDRRDYLGDASLLFEFVTPDGRYVSPMDEEAMKQYRVTSQSVAPDTEVKLEFQKDENGNEYSSLIAWQAVDEIDLALAEVGSDEEAADLPKINVSPDKYTWYIRSYVGKNAANIGYVSWGGDRRDAYGAGNVQLVFNADDGSYLDATDNKQMCQYVVTAQDVKPNTELKLVYSTDENGKEYDNLIESQSVSTIYLTVQKLEGDALDASIQAEAVDQEEESETE